MVVPTLLGDEEGELHLGIERVGLPGAEVGAGVEAEPVLTRRHRLGAEPGRAAVVIGDGCPDEPPLVAVACEQLDGDARRPGDRRSRRARAS